MKNIKTLMAGLMLCLAATASIGANINYRFRVVDNSGALVSGATVQVGSTTLTAGSTTVVPAAAGEKLLSSGAAPGSTVSMILIDLGTGDYVLQVDPTVQGELYIPLTVSKAGSTITNTNALVPIDAIVDSATIASTATTASGTNTLATGIKAKTDLLATNAADSPNAVTAQSATTANGTAIAAVQTRLGTPNGASMSADIAALQSTSTANGTAIAAVPASTWAAGTRTLTAVPNVTIAGYAAGQDPATLLLLTPANKIASNGAGAVTTSNPAVGGSGVTDASIVADVLNGLNTAAPGSIVATSAFSNLNALSTAIAAAPAATVTAMKADTTLAKTFNHAKGLFTYNATTKVITFLQDDGVTVIGTALLTVDGAGNITSRQ